MTAVGDPQGRVFGEVADLYDQVRPGYPDELIDDVLSYCRQPVPPALDVGAGTGKATAAFAARGVPVTALEPDPAMVAVLRRRCAHLPVTIAPYTFEQYQPSRPFPLLLSAQAWHWTDPELRWRRAVAAVAPGGALALFWNHDVIADRTMLDAVVAAHRRYAPRTPVSHRPIDPADVDAQWPRPELAEHPAFGDLAERLYRWRRDMTGAGYVAYLSTQSAYRILDAATRERLFAALRDIAGRRVTLRCDTVLYLARRVPD